MNITTRLTTIALGAVLASVSAFAQGAESAAESTAKVDEAKLAQLDRIAESLGLEDLLRTKIEEVAREGMAQEAEANGFDEELKDDFMKRLGERITAHDFIRQVIAPVVDDQFSVEDLGMIADFIDSDLGNDVIQSMMDGEEYDFQGSLEAGEISEEEAAQAMKLFVRFSKRQNALMGLGEKISARAETYGQRIAMEVFTDMMMNDAEESE